MWKPSLKTFKRAFSQVSLIWGSCTFKRRQFLTHNWFSCQKLKSLQLIITLSYVNARSKYTIRIPFINFGFCAAFNDLSYLLWANFIQTLWLDTLLVTNYCYINNLKQKRYVYMGPSVSYLGFSSIHHLPVFYSPFGSTLYKHVPGWRGTVIAWQHRSGQKVSLCKAHSSGVYT